MAEVLTRTLDLSDIVARKPPSPAIDYPLPPAALLLANHADEVTLVEGELIFVVLQEVEARPHQELLPAVF